MNITLILVTGSGPGGMQQLFSADLEATPLPGEHIEFNGRTYRALERSWRFVTTTAAGGEPALGTAVGLLVEQLSGPPHIVTNPSGVN